MHDNSAVTTPHKLPWFAPIRSLQILLTQTELYHPWRLYLAPGLIASRTIHVLWLILVQRTIRVLLIGDFSAVGMDGSDHEGLGNFRRRGDEGGSGQHGSGKAGINPVALTLYILFTAVSACFILTPLEVITTRLSVQRNHLNNPYEGLGAGSTTNGDSNYATHASANVERTPPDVEYAGEEEDVIALRPEDNPYEGLVHCGKSILEEEGISAFMRGWWITMLAGLLTAFA